MNRERIVSVIVRTICFTYAAASIVLAAFLFLNGKAVQLPASLDPALSIRPIWLAFGAICQAIIACSFLTAVAESVFEDESDPMFKPDFDSLPKLPAATAAPNMMIGATKQLVA